jgi:ribonuclease-3
MSEAADVAERLAEILGHRFARPELLVEALTHPSAAQRRKARQGPGWHNYERLEFLGDRVLGLVIAELLWRRFPDEPEGDLTRRHTGLVRREALAEVAGEAGLGDHAIIAGGDDTAAMRRRTNLLGDLCEAVIAALYLDGGHEAAARFIRRYWEARVANTPDPPKDPKTQLQEIAQAHGGGLPRYRIAASEGPPHRRVFTAEVAVGAWDPAQGQGRSKRAAEVEAARALLERIAGAAAEPVTA